MSYQQTIPTAKAVTLVQDRTIEILDSKLGDELDALFGRTNTTPNNVTDDGIFLPDPDRYFRIAEPTGQQVKEIERVACFTGQRPESVVYGGETATGADGHIRSAEMPWAIQIIFGEAFGDVEASDPITGNTMHRREHESRRADYYEGALRHTIDKYGMKGSGSTDRDKAIKGVELEGSMSRTIRFPIGEGRTAIRGGAQVLFTVEHFQEFPKRTQL